MRGHRIHSVRLLTLIVIFRDLIKVNDAWVSFADQSDRSMGQQRVFAAFPLHFRRRSSWIISFPPGVCLTNSTSKLARENKERPMKSGLCMSSVNKARAASPARYISTRVDISVSLTSAHAGCSFRSHMQLSKQTSTQFLACTVRLLLCKLRSAPCFK
jgi:hypothetical protein